MKNNIKTIITSILVAAILITGISFDTSITANAASTASYIQKWGTITMKPGDTKKVIVTDADGNDITTKYKWTSSDKSIVKVNMDLVSQSDFTECLELIAAGSGTVTLTGNPTGMGYGKTELTVTVKMAGPTAKQKKCKHNWKVTKKATCERTGVKTCKRCKLQKSIKRTAHKYVNSTLRTTEYDGFEYIVMCSGCDCPNSDVCPMFTKGIACDTKCDFTFVITTKERGNTIAYPYHYDRVIFIEDYDSFDDAVTYACLFVQLQHPEDIKTKSNGTLNPLMHGSYEDFEYYYGAHDVTKTVKTCKYCGKEK